ncbi:MAG: histidine kinase [Eubacteriaceae bacterium]|nr:histidine kinase [Eubacteriaceae bacterium]
MIEKTAWGCIDWRQISKVGDRDSSMNIGITTINAGSSQPTHVHYGHEQLLFVLEGEGINIINGESHPFHKGMSFYMKADTVHEEYNTGDTEIHELLVSNPIPFVSNHVDTDDELAQPENQDGSVSIYQAVEAIRDPLLESIKLPFTIFDENGYVVMRGQHYPQVCFEHCDPTGAEDDCPCYKDIKREISGSSYSGDFICPYGLTVNYHPVIFRGRQIGLIRGGHYYTSMNASDVDKSVTDRYYDQPVSTQIGIQKIQLQIAESIIRFCEFEESRRALEHREASLRNTELERNDLQKNLTIMKDTVTDLKINHHFLFNTLNCMAGMALEGNGETLYKAILDLSNMFRYTISTELQLVSLKSEITYLQTYLDLQRLRYEDSLHVEYDIADGCENVRVPFNFLQPIVENAFTHGFMSYDDDKYIKISALHTGDKMTVTIMNNGIPADDVTINRTKKSWSSKSGHGLSFVYEKFQGAYAGEFSMDMRAREEGGVEISVTVPFAEGGD